MYESFFLSPNTPGKKKIASCQEIVYFEEKKMYVNKYFHTLLHIKAKHYLSFYYLHKKD